MLFGLSEMACCRSFTLCLWTQEMPCCARKEKSPERLRALLMRPRGPHPLTQTETGSAFLPQLSQAILIGIASSPKSQTQTDHVVHVNGMELRNYKADVHSLQQLDAAGILTQKEDQFQAKLQHWVGLHKTKAAASSVSTTVSSDHPLADINQTESKCDDLDEWLTNGARGTTDAKQQCRVNGRCLK